MITVKANTKRGQALISRALHYEVFFLDDVYGDYSTAKARAWRDCLRQCENENGSDFRICSHCTHQFTVAWRIYGGWRLETHNNSYFVKEV